MRNEHGRPIIFWACRFIVGMVCLASAIGKSLDLPGFVEVLGTYRFFPDWGLWLVSLGITGLE